MNMIEKKRKPLMERLLMHFLYAAGLITIGYYTEWQVSVGIFMVLWAANIENFGE